MQAQQRAEAVRERLLANDAATKALGIRIDAIGPGTARAVMTVRADMLNGFATCHGGLIATLADSAFAFACNARDEMTVAAGFTLDILRPAQLGDVLVAECVEQVLAGKSGVYDVSVGNQRGEVVALFRGKSHRLHERKVLE